MVLLFLTSLILAACLAATLSPGSQAPNIEVKKWIKGQPMDALNGPGVIVVEFWATWCGPCVQNIPHITELAKNYPQVQFVGVSIWEDNENEAVEKFVEKMGDKMDYLVAYGGREGMAESWMQAAGLGGIPAAFIVKNKQIQWIGHPMELEGVLPEVIAGRNDLTKAQAQFGEKSAENEKRQKISKEIQRISQLFEDGKRTEARAELAKFIEANAELQPIANSIELGWQAIEDPDGFRAAVDEMLASKVENGPQQIGSVCMNLVRNPSTQELAVSTIEKLLAATERKELTVLFFAAMVYGSASQEKKARDVAKEGLNVVNSYPSGHNEQLRKLFESVLEEGTFMVPLH